MEQPACIFHLILIVFVTCMLLHCHKYRVAHDQEGLYMYKVTLCNQHAILPEANEDNKAQVFNAQLQY